MNVFMTGANGFVGLNIVSALADAGHRVTAYVRPDARTDHLEPFGVSIVRGAPDDDAALRAAMQGARAVIHTAGNTSCQRRDLPLLVAANVELTRRVVDAAADSGAERIVYTSTTSTIGADASGQPANESTPLRGFRARSPYAQTKLQAERIVLDAQARGIEAVILHPAEVIGPYDYNMQWGRMVLAVQHDQVPFMPPGGGSFCAATEVGRAHVAALSRGRSGEHYILGGADASYADFIETTAQVLGRRCRVPRTSYRWLLGKALLQEKWPALVPGQPAVEAYRMRVFAHRFFFDSSKAVRELGYRCVPLAQMLGDCASWYRRHGYFGPPATTPTVSEPVSFTQEITQWIPER
jgi:dihydroflavonol-4-reductase